MMRNQVITGFCVLVAISICIWTCRWCTWRMRHRRDADSFEAAERAREREEADDARHRAGGDPDEDDERGEDDAALAPVKEKKARPSARRTDSSPPSYREKPSRQASAVGARQEATAASGGKPKASRKESFGGSRR
jgi:hypothetical protein